MAWEYMRDTRVPENKEYLVRKNGTVTEDWNCVRKTWRKNNDAIGPFWGFEDGYEDITEQEAKVIIARFI